MREYLDHPFCEFLGQVSPLWHEEASLAIVNLPRAKMYTSYEVYMEYNHLQLSNLIGQFEPAMVQSLLDLLVIDPKREAYHPILAEF